MADSRLELLVGVTTVIGGAPTTHTYELPPDYNEALDVLRGIYELCQAALAETREYVTLQNPTVLYKSAHVVSFAIALRVGEVELPPEDVQPMGFRAFGLDW